MTNSNNGAVDQRNRRLKKRGCGCSKDEFFARRIVQELGKLCSGITRDKNKSSMIRDYSQHEMKKTLNWFDMIWFGIGAVMATKNLAGPAVILSYVISGTSGLLAVLCYTKFSVELPVADGSFAYLRVELGNFTAFIAAGNILFDYLVSGASVARSWTSYFATLCNHKPDDFLINVSSLAEGCNHLDPIAIFVSLVICAVASLSMKESSRFNSILFFLKMILFHKVKSTKSTNSEFGNYSTFAPYGARGVLKAAAMLFFAYVGFDGVATLGEEVKNPGRDIPVELIGSMVVIIIIYCLLAATLCLVQPFNQLDVNALFTIAFQAVGMNWAKYIVAFGALKGMTTVLLANIVNQATFFTHIARSHTAPPFLAEINEKTGTLCWIFSLVMQIQGSIMFLVLITLSSIGSGVFWAISENTWLGCLISVGVWLKEARKPKVWGLPLMPWIPSASIAINEFIVSSIDGASFVRFSVWTAILLVYYFLVGLHASYDAVKEIERKGANTTDIEAIAARTSSLE
ncbi:unnamed protein product [Withania somnifera]